MAGITGSLCERGSEVQSATQRMSRASPDVRLCCPLVATGSIKYDDRMIGSRAREGEGGSEAAAQMQALCTPPSQLLLPPPTFFRFPLFVNQKWKNTQTFHIHVYQEQVPGAKA